jgi:hypothetical protein
MPPVSSTKVMPTAMMPTNDEERTMFSKLTQVKKR